MTQVNTLKPLETSDLRRLTRAFLVESFGDYTAAAIAKTHGVRLALTKAAAGKGAGFVEAIAAAPLQTLLIEFGRYIPAGMYAIAHDPQGETPIEPTALLELLGREVEIQSVFIQVLHSPAPAELRPYLLNVEESSLDPNPEPLRLPAGKEFKLELAMLRLVRRFALGALGSDKVAEMAHNGRRARIRRTARTQAQGAQFVELAVHFSDMCASVWNDLDALVDALRAFIAQDEAGAPFYGVRAGDSQTVGSWLRVMVELAVRPVVVEAPAPTTPTDDRPAIERMSAAEWKEANIGSW